MDHDPGAGRRERAIRIFPNDESALRLIGALLAEYNEAWLERKYLGMQEYQEWVPVARGPGLLG
jgi:transposase-like protein